MPEPDVKYVDAPPALVVTRNEDIKRDEATGLPLEPLRALSINEPPGSNVLGKDASDIPPKPSQRPPITPEQPPAKPTTVTPAAEMPESAALQQLKNP